MHLRLSLHLSVFGCLMALSSGCGCDSSDVPRVLAERRLGERPSLAGDVRVVLNTDFETGTLVHWEARGDAFLDNPVRDDEGAFDQLGHFRVDSRAGGGDAAQGTLTSKPFVLTRGFVRFLIAGGTGPGTRVELVRSSTNEVIASWRGHGSPTFRPVYFETGEHRDSEVYVRIVDEDSSPGGYIAFDELTLLKGLDLIREEMRSQSLELPPLPPLDQVLYESLAPDEVIGAMTLPEGFQADLIAAEPDVRQPIGFCIDERGRLWVAEAYTYPKRAPDGEGRDRIVIFEDGDQDGSFETRKVFAENLNLVSGIEVGFGGCWVGAAPWLLFLPDEDGDDRFDGEAVRILDGWGYQDTHETLNSFQWGPDGWLYGCQGVATHSHPGPVGSTDDQRLSFNAGVWRVHPVTHEVQLFAEGTSNPWGIAFDDYGEMFITACVIPHLYHVFPGARFQRQTGPHIAPHTYEDIKTCADHVHWEVALGAQLGNRRSGAVGGGHAHCGAIIYLGDQWPAQYRSSILMNNIHGARLNQDLLSRKGSGYVGSHGPDFMFFNDRSSQVLSFRIGPAGSLYMIDWYDLEACHRVDPEAPDRSNGRIYRVSYGEHEPVAVDLRKASDTELVNLMLHPNEFFVTRARLVMQERGASDAMDRGLHEILGTHEADTRRLRALWALHVIERLTDDDLLRSLEDDSEYVRAWAVRLLAESGRTGAAVDSAFERLATTDGSARVRLALASAMQQWPAPQRWKVLQALMAHGEDADDHNIPMMIWYAWEPVVMEDHERALRVARASAMPKILALSTRRLAAEGTPAALSAIVTGLLGVEDADMRLQVLEAVDEALEGRDTMPMPKDWPTLAAALRKSDEKKIHDLTDRLAIVFGDPVALEAQRAILADTERPAPERLNALYTLRRVRDPELGPVLLGLLAEPELRSAAISGLVDYDEPEAAAALLKLYPELSPRDKRAALRTLATRPTSVATLMSALRDERLPVSDLTPSLVRHLRVVGGPEVSAQLDSLWGTMPVTSADKREEIARYRAIVEEGGTPDLPHGRALFYKTCQQCHTLYGTGGAVGPDLTGSNRGDLQYLLQNIVDPSAVVSKAYQNYTLWTVDGRTLSGLIALEDQNQVTLIDDSNAEPVVIARSDITEIRPGATSGMPEGLLRGLTDTEIRDLVGYLRHREQVPMRATTETVEFFHNAQDMTGWYADESGHWTSDGPIIIGHSDGPLANSSTLRSELITDDFRFVARVKLVDGAGRATIRFQARADAGGHVHGYGAGIGPDSWGQLLDDGKPIPGAATNAKAALDSVHFGWNLYEIVAVGNRVMMAFNGTPCAEYTNPDGPREGFIALELPAGQPPTEVRFRDLHLEADPAPELRTAR